MRVIAAILLVVVFALGVHLATSTPAHPERSAAGGGAESKDPAFPGGPVEADLEKALLEADSGVSTDADALEAARLLEKAIRARPERARDATILLGKLRHRSLAFRAALIVGRSQRDPLVRAALLENARRGAGFSREVVAYAFYGLEGDAEVAEAMAEGFLDEKASPAVRASQGFAAASMLKELTEASRAKVRERARTLLADPAAALELRVEAIDLLDVKGVDRAQARALLEKSPDRKVSLSAARVLLRAGEDEKYVKGELERFASSGPEADVVSKSLKEILQEGKPGM